MKKQIFNLHNFNKFSSFLKKFSVIENSLLLEIENDKLIAKTHTPDKSVVKIASVLLTDLFDFKNIETGKVGFYAINNFVKSFESFGDEKISLEIDLESVANEMTGTEIRAISKSLKLKFPCASPKIFKYIGADIIEKIKNADPEIISFRIQKDVYSKLTSLMAIDKETDTITILSKNGSVFFKGDLYEYELPGVSVSQDVELQIYKINFAFIDREDSEFIIADSRIFVNSLESETTIIIGKVE